MIVTFKQFFRYSTLGLWLEKDLWGTFVALYKEYFQTIQVADSNGSTSSTVEFKGKELLRTFLAYFLTAATGFGLGLAYAIMAGALQTVGLAAAIGLSGGIGVAAIFGLPVAIGGIIEAGLRIKNAYDNMDKTTYPLLTISVALLAFPINFGYGCLRTTWHLATLAGYVGSAQATIKSVKDDLEKQKIMNDNGGGSMFVGAIPTFVERLLVAPVVGALTGFVTGFNVTGSTDTSWSGCFCWGSSLVWRLPYYTLNGIYRGFLNGSRAALDTYDFNTETELQSFDETMECGFTATFIHNCILDGYNEKPNKYNHARYVAYDLFPKEVGSRFLRRTNTGAATDYQVITL